MTSGSLPPDDPEGLSRRFSSEMFARLLLELPEHRRELVTAWEAEDLAQLGACVHRLLGAAVYCDAPQLTTSLRELRQTLQSQVQESIERNYQQVIAVIDSTLHYSGYTGRD